MNRTSLAKPWGTPAQPALFTRYLMTLRTLRLLPAILLCWFHSGCLKLTLYNASVTKPSQVAVYFSLTDSGGNPVPNLASDKFRIYEDGGLVSVFESKQTILNPEVAALHYTLLLVDLSGS